MPDVCQYDEQPTFQRQSCKACATSNVIGYHTLISTNIFHFTVLDVQAHIFTINKILLAGFDWLAIFNPRDFKRSTSCHFASKHCC